MKTKKNTECFMYKYIIYLILVSGGFLLSTSYGWVGLIQIIIGWHYLHKLQ